MKSSIISTLLVCVAMMMNKMVVVVASREAETLLDQVCNDDPIQVNGVAATCSHGNYTYVLK